MNGPAFAGPAPAAATLRLSTFTRTALCAARPLLPRARRATRSYRAAPRMSADAAAAVSTLRTESAGEANTLAYRLFYKDTDGTRRSPWHDVPLRPDADVHAVVNFINEIPRGTAAKMEIATDEPGNPIKQDVKKGALRFYKYGPSLINYGAAPQTYEDPATVNEELGVVGDGDPVDVTEIGGETRPFGAVYPVKVLGCLGLLDEGEIDWKIIGIATADPLADQMNDVEDVERLMPGKVAEIREWFRMYKTAEGKGENEYAYGGEAKGAEFAMRIVEETHETWANLRAGNIPNDKDLALK